MNYEQKYKQALSRAKERYSACSAPALLEYIFPELKESEDEQIRKTLIDYFQAYKDKEKWGITKFNGIPTDSIIAWLEKQEEEQPVWTDNDRAMAFTLLRDVDQMTYISDEGKNERLQWLNSLENKFNNRE